MLLEGSSGGVITVSCLLNFYTDWENTLLIYKDPPKSARPEK